MPRPIPSSPSERPSLRQIAEMLGISAMTVSRALRNSPRVSPGLHAKIRKTADKLGYRPDPAVTKLMSHLRQRKTLNVTATIAAISSLPEGLETYQTRAAWQSARERAAELGYRLEHFRVSATDQFNRQLERTFVSRGIEGVLLLQMLAPGSVDHLLSWEKFAVTVASPSVLSPDFYRVSPNHFHNAKLLCAQLARRGCKRIGFVGSESFCTRTNDAFSAAADWQNIRAGGEPVKPLVFYTYELATKQIAEWFARERPDAIIVHFEQVLKMIEDVLGLRPGGPVLLVCSSVSREGAPSAGIDEHHELIGRKAIDVLTSMINRSEKNARMTHSNTLVDGEWVDFDFAPPKPKPRSKAKRAS